MKKVHLYKAIYNTQPAVLLCWVVNGRYLYYIFDHGRMNSLAIKKTIARPTLSIDLFYLSFEIFKGTS